MTIFPNISLKIRSIHVAISKNRFTSSMLPTVLAIGPIENASRKALGKVNGAFYESQNDRFQLKDFNCKQRTVEVRTINTPKAKLTVEKLTSGHNK